MDDPSDSGEAAVLDVRRAAGGDPAAFERLYRQHVARVHSLARRILGSAAEADDATQEVFLRAWRALGSFRHAGSFEGWLLRLTRNTVLNRVAERGAAKRRAEAGAEPLSEAIEADGSTAAVVARPGRPGPLDRLDLEAAIIRLPDGAREVFVLHDVEGSSHPEIAAELGVSVGTSKSQLHRARRLLRAHLTGTEGGRP